ncbi:uncharacterized protein LAESUDRAFT_762381 [Laetiporus sulphureus 93-53]|uniref:Uncharacterized protein n=1 Tax=Laetiporus sulphureus 93-53 TaxID=1314785 RepID=A0A165CK50_9APHY|nr:uncharacterized protein LAESUDRAFT_762381 [Laetiporus sulphureus 93-53]KZT02958.1 hypothetical protein LAESUDRAFT_762381 [Laetiporus sulphureus 93-53]
MVLRVWLTVNQPQLTCVSIDAQSVAVTGTRDIAVATLRKPEVLSSLSEKCPVSQLLMIRLDVVQPTEISAAFKAITRAFRPRIVIDICRDWIPLGGTINPS